MKKIKIACSSLDASPLFKTDKNLKRFGYEPELAETIFTANNIKLEWIFLKWADFNTSLDKEVVDAVMCGSAITQERMKKYDYSIPYAYFNESFLVKSDSDYKALEDLKHKKIGGIKDSTNINLLKKWPDLMFKPIEFDGKTEDILGDMIDSLNKNEIDSVVDDEPAFIDLLLKNNDFKIVHTEKTFNKWGIQFKKGNKTINFVNNLIKQTIKSGKLKEIWHKNFKNLEYPIDKIEKI